MGSLFWRGEARPYCPRKIKHTILLGDRKAPPTMSMMYGRYFEEVCFKGRYIDEYDRAIRLSSGKKSIQQLRIEEQADMFPMIANRYGIQVHNSDEKRNIWRRLHGRLEVKEHPEIEFELKGTCDIESPVEMTGFSYTKAIIDLKLTMDRESKFGEYCWGTPEYMDLFQIVFYSYLGQVPGAYLVFDYRPSGRGHKFIPVATEAMFHNPDGSPNQKMITENAEFYQAAKDRQVKLRVLIKDTVDAILKMDAEGYPKMPSYDNCSNCPLNPVNQLEEKDENYICRKAGAIQQV